MAEWLRVNRQNPCPICGKPDWCLISNDGTKAICPRVKSDKPAGNKGAGWIHQLNSSTPKPLILPKSNVKQNLKASPAILDSTYRALLSELSLSATHLGHLKRRGLTDIEIEDLGYKTLGPNGSYELIKRLQARVVKLEGVPGFYIEGGLWKLVGVNGLAIPVRDIRRRIAGVQIRCDNALGGRYRWLSSRGYYAGCSSGAPIHTAGTMPDKREVWITEGPIKADIAALKLNRLVLAVAGVGNWPGVIPIVRQLKPKRVIIAFDMDKINNSAVKLHSNTLMACLIRRGIRTFEADWDSHFKGIDDLLMGKQP